MSNLVDSKASEATRKHTFLEVGPYFRDSQSKIRSYARIPISVLKGSQPGPTLCITAGIHATEYAGISAALKLSLDFDLKLLNGNLVIAKVVNIVGLPERAYLCPVDGVNIQGTFPGNNKGSLSYLISHKVFTELVLKSDYYIDLHGGDIHESEAGFSIYYKVGNESLDQKSEGMARALGLKYVVVLEGDEADGSSYRLAVERGIPACLCELGQGDKLLQQETETIYQGIVNVMRYLGMVQESAEVSSQQKLVKVEWISVGHFGLFVHNMRPGDVFRKGDELGKVIDLEGKVLEIVHAPSDGVVLVLIHNPIVEPGEKAVAWGILEKQVSHRP